MKRGWFRDKDGTYYRNTSLILAEQRCCIGRPWRLWRLHRLFAEFDKVFAEGVARKDRLGRHDRVVEAVPFRVAYPNHPGLWRLDDLG